jgi:long-chain acyl-CoA synthetase
MVFTMLLPLLDEYEKLGRENTGTLRTLALGGQTTPIEIIRRAVRLLGTDIMMIVYGLTESSPYLTYLSKKDLAENGGYSRKISSVGKEMFSCSVRVVGEDGREIEAGGIGEVIGKGPNVMMGYYNREEENKSVLRDGWLYTGDVATMDEEGFIYIVDRKKDLIISGGENISPREVEDVIYRHPAVSECSVIGVADAKWGEHVLAVVVNKPGVELREETLIEFCRQDLAGYKIPRSVVFVEALPKDPVGKIQKKILRDWYA